MRKDYWTFTGKQLFGIVVSVVAALIVLAALLTKPASGTASVGGSAPNRVTDWVQIKSWSGNGSKQTESFAIEADEWRIHWRTSNEPFENAGIFQIYVHRASDDSMVSLAANQQGVGSDTSYVHARPGRFYLSINSANVDWSVRVEDQR